MVRQAHPVRGPKGKGSNGAHSRYIGKRSRRIGVLFSTITTLLKRAGCAVSSAHPVFIYYVVWMPAPVVTSPLVPVSRVTRVRAQVAQVQMKVWQANLVARVTGDVFLVPIAWVVDGFRLNAKLSAQSIQECFYPLYLAIG